ncbi:TPR repeat-containing protein [Dickeya chrysanthemi Ech1591]|uniref:TPR repeat-containing protein n=1 Tax=Dickeya chrysanthemi (strain Ech1591) TaxID=561229 RepID=C6CQ61_DICC1|nr:MULTISPECIES: tetratricopeptide repeat protein [Dickeya]ACT08938.1 TPR repeat-containing protein [Dickeya chrysanthemi Ech1591]TYL40988.1 tetratricopeptide repeat protein [Dickeya sp. ws52]WJM86979.1 tetratricopeptide repeat protein [Dickeya chrysanthemi]
MTLRSMVLLLGGLLAADMVYASDMSMDIHRQWSVCQYKTPASQKEACFAALSQQAQELAENHPTRADYLIWSAMVESSWAGVKDGMEALNLAGQAKNLLEKAIVLDPQALNGAAYTILGVLYYQVPGWPLGFGDDKKAERYLKTALKISPASIDANFFYGDFLLKTGRKSEARQYLTTALATTPRPGREIADQGRRAEAEKALAQLRQ